MRKRSQIHLAALSIALLLPTALLAQTTSAVKRDTTQATPLTAITVTATHTAKSVFGTASPVLVLDSTRMHSTLANGVAEILRQEPGVDITGSGANQGRPMIRGQRGQRILLLDDGIRLNNTRRQQDFGEIPALVGLDGVSRVEVVRGPASVLYGTDAIGGVINMIAAHPTYGGTGTQIHGSASYRYSTDDNQQRPSGSVLGNVGRFGFGASFSYRDAGAYSAPAGTFGKLTLPSETKVMDTGVRDDNVSLQAGYGFSTHHTISATYSRYGAKDAGFGWVDNAALGTPDAASIQIRYPDQTYNKVGLKYRGNALSLPIADRIEVTGYSSGNTRTLNIGVFAPFGPGTPPGAGAQVDSRNYTDVGTLGLRVEAAKVIGEHVVTYGVDYFRDHSVNTDSSMTTILGFGPPQSQANDTALTPNATFRSGGAFVQGEFVVTSKLSAVVGARWQSVSASTLVTPRVTTPLVDSHHSTVVGALNLSYHLLPSVNVVGSVGRAFRSPDLIELFFNGPTPEGSGYQVRSPDLKPETSLDVDLGVKVSHGRISGELFVFQNDVHDGIRIAATGTKVGPFDAYQNVNIDKLRDRGVELMAQLELAREFTAAASYTNISSKNVLDATNPVGDSYSSKVTGSLMWRQAAGRFWAEYDVRHNGERKDVALGSSPIGPVLPAFTVQDLRAGARLFSVGKTSHGLTLSVTNLGNVLFAEFSNASFFRPEPKRMLAVAWTTTF